MIGENIKAVKEAEAKGMAAIADARKQADELLKAARADAGQIRADAEEAAKAARAAMLKEAESKGAATLEQAKAEIDADEVSMSDSLALISVVGRNIGWRVGFAGRLFSVLGEAGVNIRMITQSSQEISIIMGVNEDDFEKGIRVIYDRLVASEMVEVKA